MSQDLLYSIIIILLHYYIIIMLYVIHSATFTKTIITNLGEDTYQNEMVAYLHVTCPYHAKVQTTTTAPKCASMKGTHLYRAHSL